MTEQKENLQIFAELSTWSLEDVRTFADKLETAANAAGEKVYKFRGRSAGQIIEKIQHALGDLLELEVVLSDVLADTTKITKKFTAAEVTPEEKKAAAAEREQEAEAAEAAELERAAPRDGSVLTEDDRIVMFTGQPMFGGVARNDIVINPVRQLEAFNHIELNPAQARKRIAARISRLNRTAGVSRTPKRGL